MLAREALQKELNISSDYRIDLLAPTEFGGVYPHLVQNDSETLGRATIAFLTPRQ